MRHFAVLLAFLLMPFTGLSFSDKVHVQASLLSEATSVQAGSWVWVGLRLIMDPKWHTYWRNPGDSGGPTQIKWTLPKGFDASPLEWPYPERIETPPLVSFGYEGDVLLLTKIYTPKSFSGTALLKADVRWLECYEVCIPREKQLTLPLRVSPGITKIDASLSKLFSTARANLPLVTSDWRIQAFDQGEKIKLVLSSKTSSKQNLGQLTFFPNKPETIEPSSPQIQQLSRGQPSLLVYKSSLSTQPLTQLEGVLVSEQGWRGPDSEKALFVRVDVQPDPDAGHSNSLFVIVFFAFLGGLLLNLMPCVLPVLSIKVLGLLQQQKLSKKQVRLEGLLYTAGVMVSFWILAGGLLALRATGEQLGWGFQLQSPTFIVVLSILFFLLALNLFGVFEIGTSLVALGGKTKGKAFLTGALATIVATPCTAPFMGVALGFALIQPPFVALLIFSFLGLGMAFPYLLISFVPAFHRALPKPGPWMKTLKNIMGVLLLVTVGWLLWVFGQQTGLNATFSQPSSETQWEPFSKERVKELQAQGQSIFIDFTAAWCLTCQVNKRVALSQKDVIQAFKDQNVATLRADWTNRNPAITQALQELGRSGVPVYAFYEKGQKEPRLLPAILTPQIILDTLSIDHRRSP